MNYGLRFLPMEKKREFRLYTKLRQYAPTQKCATNFIPGVLPHGISFSLLEIRNGNGVGDRKEAIRINLESH